MSFSGSRRSTSRHWRAGRLASRWRRAVLIAAGLLVVAGLGWLYGSRFLAMHRLAAEVAVLKGEVAELARGNQELQEELAHADDPAVVERKAREELGWGYPDEVLVIPNKRR